MAEKSFILIAPKEKLKMHIFALKMYTSFFHISGHSSASNTHQPHETSSSSWWWWPQTSDRSFTSWKKRLRHSIEAVRQLRGHHPREYSINEDAPPLRPPGSHTLSINLGN